MGTPLQRYVADHKFILAAVAESAGLVDPVAVDLDDFFNPLLTRAKRGPILPLDGVLIRDWDPDYRKFWPGLRFGIRVYEVEGIRFVRAFAGVSEEVHDHGYNFFAVARADYTRFYRTAVRLRRQGKPPGPPPVLPPAHVAILRRNTIDYLDPKNLKRIKAFGGRAKRGLLLAGPPGNGKTSACRWVYHECLRLGYEYRFVTPDDYRSARNQRNPADAIRRLFEFDRPGAVFFDDMDTAIRDRDESGDREDQAVFLSALDGIEGKEGVVYLFTTNAPVARIDPAFRRPGRLDVVLQFPPPNADLRRALVARWHPDIRLALDMEVVVTDTEGQSFAEIEELKNLLVMRFVDQGVWDWPWARRQFAANRAELAARAGNRIAGFAAALKGNGRN
jgi:hypothetical protein